MTTANHHHPGIPTLTNRPGSLRWPADDVTAVVHRLTRLGWAPLEMADLLDVFAFQGVRRLAAYVAKMSDPDLTLWRSDLPTYFADVQDYNARALRGRPNTIVRVNKVGA